MSVKHFTDQRIKLFGVEIEIDIEVRWTRDPAPTHTANGDGHPPSKEIDDIGIDIDDAFAKWCEGYFEIPPRSRKLSLAQAVCANDIRAMIVEAVADFVRGADLS